MSQLLEAEGRDLLRLTTAGSVDDGKSTLIGRLLADAGALTTDQLTTLAATAFREGHEQIDLARITDGLTAEREQGITIDVAYRYFGTPRRSFILADVPGHEQYTRNMVTGASKATAALLLVDVRGGMTVQTRRHACIAALLGIRDVVFAVNKMDLVDFDKAAFETVKAEIEAFTERLAFGSRRFVPVSAKLGDNVVRKSEHMPWYEGDALLTVLEQVPASVLKGEGPFRMAVQITSRPQGTETHDFRGYMGRIAQGTVRIGDRVRVAPGPLESTVTGILTPSGEAEAATVGQSVTLTLADDVDAGRGTLLCAAEAPVRESREIAATLCWLDTAPQDPRAPYLVRVGTRTVAARVAPPDYRVDVNSLERVTGSEPLKVNEIGEARIRLQDDIAFDAYADTPATGALIVVDSRTNTTVAAGMIEHTL